MDLTEKEKIESYLTKNRVKKAIRTLKHMFGLHPQYFGTKERVLGNIFVYAAAFKLCSIPRKRPKDIGIDMSIEGAMRAVERLKNCTIWPWVRKERRRFTESWVPSLTRREL